MLNRRELLRTSAAAAPWLAFHARSAAAADSPSSLIVHTRVPHNAEPPLDKLVASWITPNERFYVRSHAPVPKINGAEFRLSVAGLVDKPLEISLKQLRHEFKRQTVTATMTCAGNRRSEHSRVKPVKGVQWQAGAIGNAKWGGVSLSELLNKAGIKEGAKHVWFEGNDEVRRTSGVIPFGASIPLAKAMSNNEAMPGALVCDEMNGEPLTPDHGFPVRAVVPGFIGARSVKWLGKIVVSDRPSPNHYVADAYKLVTEGTPDEWAAASPIETFPINSVTCLPAAEAKLKAGRIQIVGYALPPGLPGRTIKQVEISTDGGRTWKRAQFTSQAKPFCWRLWEAELPVTTQTRELIVRATDSAGNVQPQSVAWNLKGYLFNAWHKTPIHVT